MGYLVLKAVISGIIVAAVSEIAKRNPAFGALVASLPLVSILSIIWLWRDTADAERIASHAHATFWFVLPSLPLFLVLPVLLRFGANFWLALSASCVLTIGLYLLMAAFIPKLGFNI